MRSRLQTWLLVAIFVSITGVYIWKIAHVQHKNADPTSLPAEPQRQAVNSAKVAVPKPQISPIRLLSQPGLLNSPLSTPTTSSNAPSRFAHRLTNTKQSVTQLARRDKAILLENALLDTEAPLPTIPGKLQSSVDPGAYIVQAKGPLDAAFRSLLQQAGATIISYVPNNAYLVRASASAVQNLAAVAQSVLPYEPYYKLKPALLDLALTENPLPDDSALNISLFADARDKTLD